jgi:hypothetical protein
VRPMKMFAVLIEWLKQQVRFKALGEELPY